MESLGSHKMTAKRRQKAEGIGNYSGTVPVDLRKSPARGPAFEARGHRQVQWHRAGGLKEVPSQGWSPEEK